MAGKYALATDCIVPKHSSSVHIQNAQLTMNATSGNFNVTGLTTPATATIGYFLTVNPPFAQLSVEAIGGATGGGSVLDYAITFPDGALPLVDVRVPVYVVNANVPAWGMALIETTGDFTVFSSPDETAGEFTGAAPAGVGCINCTWSTQAY